MSRRKQQERKAWVPSWRHHGAQGLAEFVARQEERLAKVIGRQRRVRA